MARLTDRDRRRREKMLANFPGDPAEGEKYLDQIDRLVIADRTLSRNSNEDELFLEIFGTTEALVPAMFADTMIKQSYEMATRIQHSEPRTVEDLNRIRVRFLVIRALMTGYFIRKNMEADGDVGEAN